MTKISEIASDGGDPNKKPQEGENQNEKPQQQVQNFPIRQPIPDDLNQFETRSQLGRTECVLYAFIGFYPSDIEKWYILHRRNNSLRLSIVNSLPPMILGSAVVTIGHDMYIIGGKLRSLPPVSNVFVIDCRFHTWRCLPDTQRARYHAAAGVIDGNIYVIGGCTKRGGNWIEVLDVKNQIWKTVPGPNPNIASLDGFIGPHVVMEEKIYILDRICCLAYEPRRSRWESWGIESPLRWFWHGSSGVIDDMLYSIDPPCSFGYPIVVYDPRNVVWRPVKGVQSYDLLNLVYNESKVANLGGKLVILACNYKSSWHIPGRDIWCIVIELERREDGEIWGNVVSTSRVLSCVKSPSIEHSRTVTV